jgi:hypothetical protein
MLGKTCPNLLLHIHLVTNVWVVLPGRIKNTDGGKITQQFMAVLHAKHRKFPLKCQWIGFTRI